MEQPTSPSVARNREPILTVLKHYLNDPGRLLEVGSGTGEHALFFAPQFPNIKWVVTDQASQIPNLKRVLKAQELKNIKGPYVLHIGKDDFPDKTPVDYVFTANTLHIMSWKECKTLFKLLSKRLRQGALVFFYGPFNYGGEFTSQSNAEFDEWLKARDSKSGIRQFEDVVSAMQKNGFGLLKDHEMPANNRTLVFTRLPHRAG